MKKQLLCIGLALLQCAVLAACKEAAPIETAPESTAEATMIWKKPAPQTTAAETTPTASEPLAETTVAETIVAETAVAETTVAETTASLSLPPSEVPETTAAPTELPVITAFVPTVLEGEYTMGGEPTIENRDGFTYVNGILIANKSYALPANYDPAGLAPEVQAAFAEMKTAAAADGITLKIISGYRPYRQQDSTYHNYAKRDGQEAADRYSARPGHSEHQTGYGLDLNSLSSGFGNTATGKWIVAHCAEYGFILRYPQDKEEQTGYMYEPWHLRYLNVELAKAVTESGLCLEEYLGITSVYAD